MNLYLLKRADLDGIVWDEFIGCVIAARSPEEAASLIPDRSQWHPWDCKLIGETGIYDKPYLILESFNAE